MKILCKISGSASISIQIGHPSEKDFVIFQTKKVFSDHNYCQLFIKSNGTVKFPLSTKVCPEGNIVVIYAEPAQIKSAILLILSPEIFPLLEWDQDIDDIYCLEWSEEKAEFRNTLQAYLSRLDALLFHETVLREIGEMLARFPTRVLKPDSSIQEVINHVVTHLETVRNIKLISSVDLLQLYEDVTNTIEDYYKPRNSFANNEVSRVPFFFQNFSRRATATFRPLFFDEILKKFKPLIQSIRSKTGEEILSATPLPESVCDIVRGYVI